MIELLNFIQKYIPLEALIPFSFIVLVIFIRYVFIPWNKNFKEILSKLDKIDSVELDELRAVHDSIKKLLEEVSKHDNLCDHAHINLETDIKKVYDKIETIMTAIENIQHKLETMKDDTKDNKIDLNNQLFSIKQDISDLKSKIEPLIFISKGIK